MRFIIITANAEIYATMNDDNAAGCAVAMLMIMMMFGLGLLIWVGIEITGFKL